MFNLLLGSSHVSTLYCIYKIIRDKAVLCCFRSVSADLLTLKARHPPHASTEAKNCSYGASKLFDKLRIHVLVVVRNIQDMHGLVFDDFSPSRQEPRLMLLFHHKDGVCPPKIGF